MKSHLRKQRKFAQAAAAKAQIRDPKIRTFEIVQYITGPLEVENMSDLSQQMQDQIMAALDAKSKQVELPLAVVAVRCDFDPDVPDDSPRKFFLHVIASEIVITRANITVN